ncbi:MAG: efflux RND transporter periplasmic adaptor subunit, partial [Puniceicoccaceae bacterium]
MSPTTRSHQTVFSLGCLALLLSACSRGPDAATSAAGPGERRGPLPYVEVVQTRSGTLPLEQRLSGIVRARNEVVIFPEMTGRIDEVMVDNGDAVTRGQPLVRIHARQVEEQLRQARANLRMQEAAADQARAQLQELRAQLALSDTLARRDFITERELIRLQAEVEVAEAGYARAQAVVESAEAAVEEREWLLTQTVIRSPIDGVVGRRRAEIGMRVDGSSNLFVVGDLSQVRVSVQLTEQLARQVEVGQPALIRHPQLPHEALEARISRISPFLEAGSFSTEASIDRPKPVGNVRTG